ncbi:MAG: tetratricopeptide repeat protein [Pseudomonadota bacterium]|nr:tetratricopeptide repeat protein [Pseudomonadota bacterium]
MLETYHETTWEIVLRKLQQYYRPMIIMFSLSMVLVLCFVWYQDHIDRNNARLFDQYYMLSKNTQHHSSQAQKRELEVFLKQHSKSVISSFLWLKLADIYMQDNDSVNAKAKLNYALKYTQSTKEYNLIRLRLAEIELKNSIDTAVADIELLLPRFTSLMKFHALWSVADRYIELKRYTDSQLVIERLNTLLSDQRDDFKESFHLYKEILMTLEHRSNVS